MYCQLYNIDTVEKQIEICFPAWFLTSQAVHRVIERKQISTVLGFVTAFSHLQKLLCIRDYREAEKYRSEVIQEKQMFHVKYGKHHRNNRELKGCCIFLLCVVFIFMNIKSVFPYLVCIFTCSQVCDVYICNYLCMQWETHQHTFSFPQNVYQIHKMKELLNLTLSSCSAFMFLIFSVAI